MNWHTEPVSPPYKCSLCGCGAESDNGPFLVTDFMYEQGGGFSFVDEISGGNLRFTICSICFFAAAKLEGSATRALIIDGEDARKLGPQVVQDIPLEVRETFNGEDQTERIATAVVNALMEHEAAKNKARMAKARAGRKKA